jgi:hypothetical protein
MKQYLAERMNFREVFFFLSGVVTEVCHVQMLFETRQKEVASHEFLPSCISYLYRRQAFFLCEVRTEAEETFDDLNVTS